MNNHFHFVGIGGIGMSALAKILKSRHSIISGCDSDLSQDTIAQLKSLGCAIYKQNKKSPCPLENATTIVYSTAIAQTNPDIIYGLKNNITLLHRSEILSDITKDSYCIAVTGSHGKTTTTSLLGHILLKTGHNPTIISGGIIRSIASNAHIGDHNLTVIEADESDRSFLNLHPNTSIITNIDFEHAETYHDITDVLETYKKFIDQILTQKNGIVLINGDDVHCKELLKQYGHNLYSFGFEKHNDIHISQHTLKAESSTFTINCFNKEIFTLPLMAKHNIANAAAALGICYLLNKHGDFVFALASFEGIDRRFSIRGTYNGATIIDDYGHHPVEIEKTIQMARARNNDKLIVVFQPHRYSRTKALWNDFVLALRTAPCDEIIITDIYPASEEPIANITSENLVETCNTKHIRYIPLSTTKNLSEYIKTIAKPNSSILFLGAGNAYLAGLQLLKK